MRTEEKGGRFHSPFGPTRPLFLYTKNHTFGVLLSAAGTCIMVVRKGGDNSDLRQEDGMPVQDLFVAQAKHEQLQEEKAIVRAVIRYFEKAAPHSHASGADMESSIVNALHRYFQGSK